MKRDDASSQTFALSVLFFVVGGVVSVPRRLVLPRALGAFLRCAFGTREGNRRGCGRAVRGVKRFVSVLSFASTARDAILAVVGKRQKPKTKNLRLSPSRSRPRRRPRRSGYFWLHRPRLKGLESLTCILRLIVTATKAQSRFPFETASRRGEGRDRTGGESGASEPSRPS